MKRLSIITAVAAASITAVAPAMAQEAVNPSGIIMYSLPKTTVHLTVTAQKETFLAGPYAQYAKKYLGNAARTEDNETYSIKTLDITPYIEADTDNCYTVNLTAKEAASSSFLKFCSQGLISMPDSYTGKSENWRFPSIAGEGAFNGKDLSGNLTSATTTLYKTERTEDGFRKVAVQQSEVVEKSLEKKAAEAAQTIFNLRKSRVQIITGDTDATYSGEAMKAALDEITKLEDNYLTLFYGITEISLQTMNFDVTPTEGNAKQMYVAFRISDTKGLLPAGNVEGRPIVLHLVKDGTVGISDKSGSIVPAATKKASKSISYRTPATVTAKIIDGDTMLLQTRFPVYQLGCTCAIYF